MKKLKCLIVPILLCLMLLSMPLILGTKISGTTEDRMGAFTGPVGGSAQDDNVKASLDLAHTDLATMLTTDTDALALLGLGTGDIFYVDSGIGGATGLTWATAVATIDDAVNLCTNDAGDFILVAPGHAEDMGTTDPDVDKTGVTIIGLGEGEQRPVLSADTSTDIFTIDGDDIAVYNLVFLAHTPDVAKGIDITANSENTVIKNCTFTVHTAGTDEFLIAINIGADADNVLIEDNQFYMTGGNATEAILFDGTCDYPVIRGNEIFGDYSTACIYGDSTGAGVQILIEDNVLYNGDDTGGLNTEPGIELKSTTSGIITGNTIVCDEVSPDVAIVAAACYISGNTYTETIGIAGTLDIGLEVGKVYTRTMSTVMTGTTDQMFTVAGGNIEIISFFGQCTTAMASNPGDMTIEVDATDGTDYDNDFSTTVTIDTVGAGDLITFTSAVSEGVLTFVANQNAGNTLSWFCPPGEIEQLLTSTGTGAVEWFMTFRPLEPGVTVTSN